MDRYIIAGNWKMNVEKEDVKAFFTNYNGKMASSDVSAKRVTKIICPTFPLLTYAKNECTDSGVDIGAQNVSEHEKGAFTGEVSASILKSIDIKYCIIGHSERRQYFGDTDDIIKQKWFRLREAGINPIICIGETLSERESGQTFEVIKKQIGTIFDGVALKQGEDMMIAYEPVWAIGTGKTATPEIAQEVHKYIRELLTKLYHECAPEIPLLYGGSVKPSNIKELLEQDDINGALIGGASLDSKDYADMVKIAGEVL